MIRRETDSSWILVTHPDHARLAGEFADAWGNARFPRPEPFSAVSHAVHHHDDGWLARDAAPTLASNGKPEAFTSSLVGAYSAFEEIDLPNYLRVRGAATAAVAAQNTYAGILTSMHTYNLLTEQADASTIRPEHLPAYTEFLASQLAWQQSTAREIGASDAELVRGFEFLQCCDNLSLIVCSNYSEPRDLRHTHPDHSGRRHAIRCTHVAPFTYALSPWPLGPDRLELDLPCREIPKDAVTSLEAYREAFAAAPVQTLKITLIPGA